MERKILLVDANVCNRRFIRDVLAITGLEVIEASNCQQAVEIAINKHPRLILLAADMPCLNRSETFAILQQCSTTCMIPVLSITYNNEEQPTDSYLSTAWRFNKPVPIQALIDKIRPYVNAAHSLVNGTIN